MRNIALTFLGCFTILAACSNSDDAEKPVVPVPTGDVAIYTTTSSLTRDLARDAVNFSPKDNLAPNNFESCGTVPDDGWFRSSYHRFYLLQPVTDETG